MPPLKAEPGSRAYWRSLNELADSPDFRRFVENEFPASADQMLTPASRRNFLKVMGASMALAGMTACRWPTEEIVPFAQRPDGYTPGVPQQYATAMELGGAALGLLVTSQDGRPVKVEGNPLHPQSLGATDSVAQASLLELYDPERSRTVMRNDAGSVSESSWEEFESFAAGHFAAGRSSRGRGLRVLSEATSSPSVTRMRDRLLRAFPEARWYEYEAASRDHQREGSTLAFGRPHRSHLFLDRAEVIVSLDEDFLLNHPAAVRYTRDYTEGRNPDGDKVSRLYAVESGYSLTGSMADHRLALPSKMVPVIAACLAAELFLELGLPLPPSAERLRRTLERFQFHPLYTDLDFALARDLMDHRGSSLVLAGPRQPAEVHALVHLINDALGNVGTTVSYTTDPEPSRPHHFQAIRELATEMHAGDVETLVLLGGNPAYDAPADLDFAALLDGVPTTIRLGLYEDETSAGSSWHLPRAHYLESWGDARGFDGTYGVAQPLIEPLFGGRTSAELLALIAGESTTSAHEIVKGTFATVARGGDDAWRSALHDGLVAGSAWSPVRPVPGVATWADMFKPYLRARGDRPEGLTELVFVQDANLHDGRFANNGWLQELPDPLTLLTWDNAALIGVADAATFGVEHGDRVRLTADDRSLDLPVYVMPGQAAGSISVWLGYGRRTVGKVGRGAGFDVYPLRTLSDMSWTHVSVEKIKGRYDLATTQDHWAIDAIGQQERAERARVLVREIEIGEYREHPEAVKHIGPEHHPVELWPAHEYEGHKWGMSIDLNSCTGCNACVVACQAENNIPVVGKQEVINGREMHWIRVDRYFAGDPDSPTVAHQPVACQHCEDAPCEQVCPVAATVHDSEGLNVMVYNRCIGTRYCANNCPFKVRRFNYFNNRRDDSPLEMMIYNPEVTVRTRGVMEKCSFCVQRINAVKIEAKNERRPIADGEVVPACAQVCPAQAIGFGDLNDPASAVRRDSEQPRAYALLEETQVKPRVRYLARVRNSRESDGDA